MTQFYRFRSLKALIDEHHELERQTIFFASPEQLNDPMEGYRDIFWAGDHPAWRNLFSHYLRCLERAYLKAALFGDKPAHLSTADLQAHASIDEFPTDCHRAHFAEMRTLFFSAGTSQYIEAIARGKRKIRRDELAFHLQNVHAYALQSIARIYEEHGLKSRTSRSAPSADEILKKIQSSNFFDYLNRLSEETGNPGAADAMFRAGAHANAQTQLIHRFNHRTDPGAANKNFLLLDFPAVYIRSLESIIFPRWYTACFMSECCNSAVWGHYSASHTGVCLIFESETHQGREVLRLRGTTGWSSSGPAQGVIPFPFDPIDYAEGFGEIDFFRSIGRLPVPVLNATWYSDGNGGLSECAQDMLKDEQAWRNRYWNQFSRDLRRKTPDWAYEKEYRLVLNELLSDRSNPKERTFTYEFSSLAGLIFGINTPVEDKLRIVGILQEKCAQHCRKDFPLYQAYYDSTQKCIKHQELSLIKLA